MRRAFVASVMRAWPEYTRSGRVACAAHRTGAASAGAWLFTQRRAALAAAFTRGQRGYFALFRSG